VVVAGPLAVELLEESAIETILPSLRTMLQVEAVVPNDFHVTKKEREYYALLRHLKAQVTGAFYKLPMQQDASMAHLLSKYVSPQYISRVAAATVRGAVVTGGATLQRLA
jgi:hypothetical protein